MKKLLFMFPLFALNFLSSPEILHAQSKDVKNYVKALKGKDYFLKIDLLKGKVSGITAHATNVYSDGSIEYAGFNLWARIEAQLAEDFEKEVEQKFISMMWK